MATLDGLSLPSALSEDWKEEELIEEESQWSNCPRSCKDVEAQQRCCQAVELGGPEPEAIIQHCH